MDIVQEVCSEVRHVRKLMNLTKQKPPCKYATSGQNAETVFYIFFKQKCSYCST